MKGYAASYYGEENEVIAISNDPTQLTQHVRDYLDELADYAGLVDDVDQIVPEGIVCDKIVAAIAHQYKGASEGDYFDLVVVEEVDFV